jgi:hypothetical protein
MQLDMATRVVGNCKVAECCTAAFDRKISGYRDKDQA